jgi:DNA-binding transcriptional regulator YhcF (GntR family)
MAGGTESGPLPRIRVFRDSGVAVSDQITVQLTYLIGQGILRPGQRLWSIRQLSSEYGINHNVALVAFGTLQRVGLIESNPARGYYVSGRQSWDMEWVQSVRNAMKAAPAVLGQLREQGIPLEQFVQALVLTERLALSTPTPALEVVFAECNPASLTYFADKLDRALSIRVQRRLLSELDRDRGSVPDIIATNIYHLGEVTERCDAGKIALVGLSVRVAEETRHDLREIPPRSRIASVAPARVAMANMAMIAATAVPAGHEIIPLNLEDEAEMQDGLERADVVMVHAGNLGLLSDWQPRKRFVIYETEYDPLSVAYLQETIERVSRQLGVTAERAQPNGPAGV